jgi:hypothetical protein
VVGGPAFVTLPCMRARWAQVAGCAAVTAALMHITAGTAQEPAVRTVTLFQPFTPPTSLRFVDAPPKSPTRRFASARFRLSPGDQLISRIPALDREGGSRAGTIYVHATVLVGGRFESATTSGSGAVKLRDGQIVMEGVNRLGSNPASVVTPIAGGSGAYLGAHGQATTEVGEHGATITLHLLS